MNDQDILDAYRSLSAPESPPVDLLGRVDRGIRRRRTVRRSVAGVAALAVVGGVCVATLGGSDPTTSDQSFADDTGTLSTLTFTHEGGSTYTFAATDLAVFCTTADSGAESLILTRADLVDDIQADREPGFEALESGPLVYVELLVDKVSPGEVFRLPYEANSGDSSDRAMTFFVASDEGGKRPNEVSSAEPGAAGVVTVHEATCGPTPTLSLEIDGTLGSEVERPPLGPALAITGEYRS